MNIVEPTQGASLVIGFERERAEAGADLLGLKNRNKSRNCRYTRATKTVPPSPILPVIAMVSAILYDANTRAVCDLAKLREFKKKKFREF